MASRNVTVTHINPMSAFKVGICMALVGFAAWLIAVSILYVAVDAFGVVASMNSLISGVGGDTAISFPFVLAIAALLGAIGVVFVALMAPLTAFIYNALTGLVGGVEVELTN
ncbi:DUF3566 domain-containing protein [Corynebacterium sp. MSK041]|uniref:DUF3566 domain-containing protein n=1 Tax=Corynebacterium sp. MSK041 TaxID=3050194 RepID=UPI00254A9E2D|nr:DUF3566 domain-containing protein [Corynebacterium sp. MSK041]MDK8796054.1 DUF3566 domain-containing protein [Corynebacterium sp. MSK041]